MAEEIPEVAALRAALSVSPENVPLRTHLAATLLKYGQAAESVAEYRDALQRSPDDASLKIGLAKAYDRLGKRSHAIVIAEELAGRPDPAPEARLLYARLLLKEGDVPNAVAQYKAAAEEDPSLRDRELEERLGIGADEEAEIADGRLRAYRDEPEEEPGVEPERPKTRFADVGGMKGLKDEIRMKIIHPLTHAEMFKAYGKAVGGGVLMYGPPGCGKTHLARATAGEVKASFLAVGINDVLDMWIGTSERNLHALFEQARRSAPCVLFFDEVDALGASRTDMRSSAGRHLINQFLSEMDGVGASNDGVLILAATNAPWHLDPAFRRPGRFDRILFVPPPDAPARAAILEILLRGKPAESVDFDHVAKKTPDFSGADLKAVVDRAIEAKLAEAMRTGVPAPLTTKDLVAAAKSGRPTTRDWFSTARNYALYSNEGGQYDDVLDYLKLKR
jgi:SpoVK/Ycf46/Vps4 family AAA+-type ATPase